MVKDRPGLLTGVAREEKTPKGMLASEKSESVGTAMKDDMMWV